MTPTQIARRSDALYADGTCGMTRRVLCDMVAQREADLEDAKAEFDKMDKWHSAELQAALAENAKLRELVIAQCECVKHDDCNECVYYSEGKCMFPFESMYRELGVEVDDGAE